MGGEVGDMGFSENKWEDLAGELSEIKQAQQSGMHVANVINQ